MCSFSSDLNPNCRNILPVGRVKHKLLVLVWIKHRRFQRCNKRKFVVCCKTTNTFEVLEYFPFHATSSQLREKYCSFYLSTASVTGCCSDAFKWWSVSLWSSISSLGLAAECSVTAENRLFFCLFTDSWFSQDSHSANVWWSGRIWSSAADYL